MEGCFCQNLLKFNCKLCSRNSEKWASIFWPFSTAYEVKIMKKLLFILFICFLGLNVFATPTKVIVRAKSKDAKFIGSSMGGALVVIRDKSTNEILAKGKTQGSTGNTKLIMNDPKERYKSITDDETAKFQAEIDLEEPTFVRIEVLAPFNKREAAVAASTEVWLIPGRDILGDGIILEISGFVVDIISPRTHQYIPLASLENGILDIKANVVMMCGCPISDGGIWDATQMQVKAIIKKDGVKVSEQDLKISSTSLFEAKYEVSSPGLYEVIVYAYSLKNENTGVDKLNYIITQ